MDPVNIKFAQLIAAEVLGGVAFLAGVVLAFLALSGKTQWIVQLPGGFKAKMINASPGAVLAMIGFAMVWLSLHSTVERDVTTTEFAPPSTIAPPEAPGLPTPQAPLTSPATPVSEPSTPSATAPSAQPEAPQKTTHTYVRARRANPQTR